MTIVTKELVETQLKTINIQMVIDKIENDIAELNDYQWRWTYKPIDKLAPKIEEFVDQINWWLLDSLAINTRAYWCGFLTLEPWGYLEMSEQTILNILTHEHLEIALYDGAFLIRYKQNEDTDVHTIFTDYWKEWDGNIIPSFNAMMRRLEEFIEVHLHKQIPEGSMSYNRWGEWEEEYMCKECENFIWIRPRRPMRNCPNCNADLYKQNS